MLSKDEISLKSLQTQIIKGYSQFYSEGLGKNVYVRHLDNFISSEVDSFYKKFLKKAISSGLLTEKDAYKNILKDKYWTLEKEKQISDQKEFLKRLNITKSKKILKAEIQSLKHQISLVEKEIESLENEKSNLLGLTAENYATKKVNNYFIHLSCYKDSKLESQLFTDDEFNELDDDYLKELIIFFNDYSSNFSQLNLKKIALSPSYLNYFYLSNDNPMTFYGKPVCNLTFYQAEVFSHAKHFKQILNEMKTPLPEEFMEDPEKLVEWFESNKNAENLMKRHENSENMNMSIVGATKEDLDNLGLQSQGRSINLAQEAAKRGGALTMNDMLKLQGL